MKDKLVPTALGLLVTLLCVAALPALPGKATSPSDSEINQALDAALVSHRETPSFLIDAVTVDGIVTLAGTVDNILAKERALAIAKSIAGVRAVVDRVDVVPPLRRDEDIRRNVTEALQANPATGGAQLNVSADAGKVSLQGVVRSRTEENLCIETAKGVRGVRRVDARLRIESSGTRTDREIEEEIVARLESSVWIDKFLINVEVRDGVATLSGFVGTEAEKTRAAVNAQVAGVRTVLSDELEISRYLDDGYRRPTTGGNPSSADVKRAVEDALYFDPRVTPDDIEVLVKNGAVRLRGTVANERAKSSAVDDARNAAGVRQVENELWIREPGDRKDSEIESDVNSAIARDPYLNWIEVQAHVIGGKVILSGNVRNKFERRHAAELARNTAGVSGVENMITVGRDRDSADWKIKSDIQSGLYRSPLVESKDVVVTVKNGVATLSGNVSTWRQYHAAREIALEEGARIVDNNLKVTAGQFAPIT